MTEDELILTHILKCSRSELYLNKPSLTESQQKQFKSYQLRLAQGEPLQYILGVAPFLDLELKVDPRVLIPRPETELLVEEAIRRMEGMAYLGILDLGTGSGNIAIALAKSLPQAEIFTVDISMEAIELAQENAQRHGVNEQIRFFSEDMNRLLPFFISLNGRILFDLIISNPPYIPEDQISTLPANVQREPSLALKAGKDGFKFYRDIIEYAPWLLRQGGHLMMEFGDGQEDTIQQLIANPEKFIHTQIIQDLTGRNRIVCTQKR